MIEPEEELAGNEKKSLVQRFLLVLSLALPLAVMVAGILIVRASNILPGYPPVQKNIIGGLFITYSVFRLYKVFLVNKRQDQ